MLPTIPPRLLRCVAGSALASLALLVAPAGAAAAGPTWWQPAGLAGKPVTALSAGGGTVTAVVAGQVLTSADGSSFVPAPATAGPVAPAAVTAAGDTWSLGTDGRVYRSRGGSPAVLDSSSPDLGAGAHLIAALAASPGVVITVSTAGVVWRRSPDGSWGRSLLLLPTTLLGGTPKITAVTAFADRPISCAIYLGTAGYGTLLSSNGGDDWTRADPGLPGDVLSLAGDSSTKPPVVWAGTSTGLYVHRLQPIPGIPAYAGEDLRIKALITVAVCLVVTAAAAVVLNLAVPEPKA